MEVLHNGWRVWPRGKGVKSWGDLRGIQPPSFIRFIRSHAYGNVIRVGNTIIVICILSPGEHMAYLCHIYACRSWATYPCSCNEHVLGETRGIITVYILHDDGRSGKQTDATGWRDVLYKSMLIYVVKLMENLPRNQNKVASDSCPLTPHNFIVNIYTACQLIWMFFSTPTPISRPSS